MDNGIEKPETNQKSLSHYSVACFCFPKIKPKELGKYIYIYINEITLGQAVSQLSCVN